MYIPKPDPPIYMTKEQDDFALVVLGEYVSIIEMYADFIKKHGVSWDSRFLSFRFCTHHANKIALRHLTWEQAIKSVVLSLEKSLTRSYMHIVEEDKRILFYADSQILLNQVYDKKAKPPLGLVDLPPRIVIKRIPADNQTEAES
jgi:hypothetical protein